MRERLEEYLLLCQEYQRNLERGDEHERQTAYNRVVGAMPAVRAILSRLDPALSREILSPEYQASRHRANTAIQQALGILQDLDALRANLKPDAPSLVADRFHPHVWGAAAGLWNTGRYRVAVGQAAIALSTHIASKAESPLMDRKLVNQVFASAEPPPGQVRLHLPGDKRTHTWKSKQEGLQLIAQGAFAGIRNVAAHSDEEWSEQVALEHLAVLSVVARWADETKLTLPGRLA
jgi:hypothetical protein